MAIISTKVAQDAVVERAVKESLRSVVSAIALQESLQGQGSPPAARSDGRYNGTTWESYARCDIDGADGTGGCGP